MDNYNLESLQQMVISKMKIAPESIVRLVVIKTIETLNEMDEKSMLINNFIKELDEWRADQSFLK